MSLRSLLIIAPGALLLVAALALVFVNKDDGHGHSHGHGHGHSHGGLFSGTAAHDHAGHDHGGPAPTHDHAEHSDEWRAIYGETPLPLVWKSLLAARDQLLDGLDNNRDLAPLTAYSETIHLCAHALWEQVSLPTAEAQRRLDATLSQTAGLADVLLEALHHGERHAARAALSRLDSAIGVSAIRLPDDLQAAAATLPTAPLFAPTPKHDHKH